MTTNLNKKKHTISEEETIYSYANIANKGEEKSF